MRRGIVLLIVSLGCTRPTAAKPDPEGDKPVPTPALIQSTAVVDAAPSCSLPTLPTGLVLGIERHVLPIGEPYRREAAEVTTHGVCSSGVECARISAAELDSLWRLFVRASGVRHVTQQASPHYGSRHVIARWTGGSCEVSDSSQSQVLRDDWDIFYASFDAIINAVIVHRPDAGAP